MMQKHCYGILAVYRSWGSNWLRLMAMILITSLLGLVLVQTEIADSIARGETSLTWQPWVWTFSSVYSFTFIAPVIVYCCHQWSFNKQQLFNTALKLVLLYLPITLVFISVMLLLRHIAYFLMDGSLFPVDNVVARYVYEFPKLLGVYVGVIFITYTKIYYDSAQKEQLNAAKLENQLQAARMQTLRNQLQPHFLFNTLNLISGTVYQDAEKADSIITRLGDLLRYSLATEQKSFVPLKEEMQVMYSYLEIAQLRFGDRLSVDINMATDTELLMIPAMMLQPLLENAVKYGIEPAAGAGGIELLSSISNEKLLITVTNPLLTKKIEQESFGVGLQNARNRLDLLYGQEASIKLTYLDDKAELTIVLPALKWEDSNDSK